VIDFQGFGWSCAKNSVSHRVFIWVVFSASHKSCSQSYPQSSLAWLGLPLSAAGGFSRVADSELVNPRLTPRPKHRSHDPMAQIELIYASFFRPRAALIHKFCACQDSEKIYQKNFLTDQSFI
jgi:hypothetical protein